MEKEAKEIDFTSASLAAIKALYALYKDEVLSNILVEEFEKSSDSWKITIGFQRKSNPNQGQIFGDPYAGREFKTFSISLEDGSVQSMKLRRI